MEYETPKREKADTEIHDVVSSFSLFVCIVLSQSEFCGFSLVVFVLFGCACVRACVCVFHVPFIFCFMFFNFGVLPDGCFYVSTPNLTSD